MPLPFAPKPDESKVYQSLKSTLLSSVTPDQLDTLRGEVFAQGTNGTEDEYRRLILLGAASQAASLSGPLPGTGVIKVVEIATNNRFTIFQPAAGEVYRLVGAELEETAGTATKAGILELWDGSDGVRLIYESTGGETEFEPIPNTIFIDNLVYLTFSASSGFSAGETADIKCGFIRVR